MYRYRTLIVLVLFGVVPVVAAFFVALSILESPPAGEPTEVSADLSAVPAPVVAGPAPLIPEVVSAPAVALPEPMPALATDAPVLVQAVVAARDLEPGTLLGPDDVLYVTLGSAALPAGAIVTLVGMGQPEVIGHAVRVALSPGDVFVAPALVAPGRRGFAAAVLRAGMRAVPVRVGAATGQSGLVDPGDRVDVVYVAPCVAGADVAGGGACSSARRVADDLRVVSVDRRIEIEGPDGALSLRQPFTTVTLEVSPPVADALALAEMSGSLSLVLRSSAPDPGPPVASVALALPDLMLTGDPVATAQRREVVSLRVDALGLRVGLTEAEARVAEAGRASDFTVRVHSGDGTVESLVFAPDG